MPSRRFIQVQTITRTPGGAVTVNRTDRVPFLGQQRQVAGKPRLVYDKITMRDRATGDIKEIVLDNGVLVIENP